MLDPNKTTNILVSSIASPAPKVYKAILEPLGKSADSPKSASLAPSSDLNDKKSPDAGQLATVILRLTCNREFCDGNLFSDIKDNSAALPRLILPQACLSKVIRMVSTSAS